MAAGSVKPSAFLSVAHQYGNVNRAELLFAVLIGLVQGIVEWLPISSQGNVSIVVTLVSDINPTVAVDLALFVQVGTIISASVYYRDDIAETMTAIPEWRPRTAFSTRNAETTFIFLASAATGIVGIPLYLTLREAVSGLAGGLFIAVIGALLIGTGLLQRASEAIDVQLKETPTLLDTLLVGSLQGLTILPGISRSGTTVSTLLLRGYAGPTSLRLSFLLSIPASLGAAILVIVTTGGLPGISPAIALIALTTSAVVGYGTIDALMRVVARIPFWLVCIGLGSLAVIGGLAIV